VLRKCRPAGVAVGSRSVPTVGRNGSQDETHRRRPAWLALLAAAVTFVGIFGVWSRQNAQNADLSAPTSPGGLFLADQARGTQLAAAGRTRGLAEPCTAWLLDTGGDSVDAAYAVTAARCVGVEDAVSVRTDEPVTGATIDVNAFARVTSAGEQNHLPVAVDRLVWASRRWTDLAVLRLATTYGALADAGVRPVPTAALPSPGDELLVASVPVEGIEVDQQFLRGSRCAAGSATDVLESGLLLQDARATDCAGILDGSRGAPVFNEAGDVVAMVATTTLGAGAGPDCGPDRPCEVREGGVQPFQSDTTYVIPVEGLRGCFDAGSFRLGPGCPLEDPASAVAAKAGETTAEPGSVVAVRLAPGSPEPDAGVADRTGALGATDCFDPTGWTDPLPAAQWSLDVTLPPEPGWSIACVGLPGQPTPVVIRAAVS
jgi:S1-C subfamily serine protease